MIADYGEILNELGVGANATDQQKGLINRLHREVERLIKRKIRNNVEQATYTEYLGVKLGQAVELDGLVDLIGDRVTVQGRPWYPSYLQLSQTPVRTVISLYEDPAAWAGTNTEAFPPQTQLFEGTHFYRDLNEDGFCKSGKLVRIAGAWCSRDRSIKVTYVSGYTRDELDGNTLDQNLDASDIKRAVLMTMQHCYEGVVGRQGSAATVAGESLGAYSVRFDTDQSYGKVVIPSAARDLLSDWLSLGALI